MTKNTDFSNARPGDVVLCSGREHVYPAKIKRVTETMVVLEGRVEGRVVGDGQRYSRKTGGSVGTDTWSSSSIWIPEEKELQKVVADSRERTFRNKLIRSILDKVSFDKLDKMPTEKLQAIDNSCSL